MLFEFDQPEQSIRDVFSKTDSDQLLFQVLDAAPDDELPVSRNDTGVLVLCFTVNNVLHRNEFSGVTKARSNPLQIPMFLFADTTQ